MIRYTAQPLEFGLLLFIIASTLCFVLVNVSPRQQQQQQQLNSLSSRRVLLSSTNLKDASIDHQQFADLRKQVLFVPPNSARELAVGFKGIIDAVPRFDGKGHPAPKRINNLTQLINAKDDHQLQNVPYIAGISIFAIVPIVLLSLQLSFGIVFCVCRCCFNQCGKRRRTKAYGKRTIYVYRMLMFLNFVLLLMFGLFGHIGNSGISRTIEHARDVAYHGTDFVFDAIDMIGEDAFTRIDRVFEGVLQLNHTIFTAIPSKSTIEIHVHCLNSVVNVTKIAQKVVGELRLFDRAIETLPNLTNLLYSLDQMQLSIDSLPNMNGLADRLRILNTTVNSMPNIQPLKHDIQTLNQTLSSFSNLSQLATQIEQTHSTISDVSTYAIEQSLQQSDHFWNLVPNLNLLHADMNINSGVAFRNVGETRSNLIALQTAIDAAPNGTQFVNELRKLNQTTQRLGSSLSVRSTIVSLNASIASLPNMNQLKFKLQSFQTYLEQDFGLSPLKRDIVAANDAIESQPSMDVLLNQIRDIQSAVQSLKRTNFHVLFEDLIELNATLQGIGCVGGIIRTIVQINTSLVILPPQIQDVISMWDNVQPQIDNITMIQSDLTAGARTIMNLNETLGNLPNFTALEYQIVSFNDSSSSMPDLRSTVDKLDSFNSTLGHMPNLTSYIVSIDDLSSTMNINLTSILDSLSVMQMNLQSMPDLGVHVTTLAELDTIILSIKSPLSAAIGFLSSNPSHAPGGFPIASLLDGLMQLEQTRTNRPDNSVLSSNLGNLNSTIATMPNLQSTKQQVLDLDSALLSFPDIDDLINRMDDVGGSIHDLPDFDSLVIQLVDLNSTVQNLPSMIDIKVQVSNVQASSENANINATIDQLKLVADLTIDNSVADQLNSISDLTTSFNVSTLLDDAKSQLSTFRNYTGEQGQEKKHQLLETVDDAMEWAKTGDFARAAVMGAFIFLPMILSLCGVCGCVLRRGFPSCCMAVLFVPLSVILLIFSSILLPVAVVLHDNCPHTETLLLEAASTTDGFSTNLTLYVNGTSEYIDPQYDTSMYEIARYYLICDGVPPPALLMSLDEIGKAQLSQFNISDMVNSGLNGTGMQLVPQLMVQIDDIASRVTDVLGSTEIVTKLLECHGIHQLYSAARDTLCVTFKDGIIVQAWSLFFLGLLTCCGCCLGVRGNKRLRKSAHLLPSGVAVAPAPQGAFIQGANVPSTAVPVAVVVPRATPVGAAGM